MGKKNDASSHDFLLRGAAPVVGALYVPTVHTAQVACWKSPLPSISIRGEVAYFITAVLIPGVVFVFVLNWDPTVKAGNTPTFEIMACMKGLFGGNVGGQPGAFVHHFRGPLSEARMLRCTSAPLVFCRGRPIINTIATILYFNPAKKIGPIGHSSWGPIDGKPVVAALVDGLQARSAAPHGATPGAPVAQVAPSGVLERISLRRASRREPNTVRIR